jgi:hypothetical protein
MSDTAAVWIVYACIIIGCPALSFAAAYMIARIMRGPDDE